MRGRGSWAWWMAAAVAAGATGAARGGESAAGDLAQLTAGVKAIAAPGVPGTVAVWGEGTFCVVSSGKEGAEVCAVGAGRMGKGRYVMLPHSAFADASVAEVGDTGRFMENIVKWAGNVGEERAVKVATLGSGLKEWLTGRGFEAEEMRGWPREKVKTVDVVWCGKVDLSEVEIEVLKGFIEEGRGFVGAQTPWGWQQITEQGMEENGMCRLLAGAGAAWTSGMTEATLDGGMFAVDGKERPLLNGSAALDVLEKGGSEEGAVEQTAMTVMQCMRAMVGDGGRFEERLRGLAGAHRSSVGEGEGKAITTKDGLARVVLAYEILEAKKAKADEVRANARAASFPGAVGKDAERVSREVVVDTGVPGWASTGLYAAAGERVVVEVSGDTVEHELEVQIGSHTDELWDLAEWRRSPEIVRRWMITSERTEAASAFGGLVYVVVPPRCIAGEIRAKISGVVEAPYFELGKMSNEEWKEVRERPGPWAELASRKVVLTVPAWCVRELEDAEGLMRVWDEIMDSAAELGQIDKERLRPERYCMDEQISAGYMHAGYPIMTHMDVCDDLTKVEVLKGKGSWGLFHELGHNHQVDSWTFEGTGEVTCNLWSLYLMQRVCGKAWGECHESIGKRGEMIEKYVKGGRDFEAWKRDPFLALVMYEQLVEGFGWEPIKKVFAEYRKLKPKDRPKTEERKRDEWMVRMSRAVGRNLGPFFKAWGIPVSEGACEEVEGLEAWMPAEMGVMAEG